MLDHAAAMGCAVLTPAPKYRLCYPQGCRPPLHSLLYRYANCHFKKFSFDFFFQKTAFPLCLSMSFTTFFLLSFFFSSFCFFSLNCLRFLISMVLSMVQLSGFSFAAISFFSAFWLGWVALCMSEAKGASSAF